MDDLAGKEKVVKDVSRFVAVISLRFQVAPKICSTNFNYKSIFSYFLS